LPLGIVQLVPPQAVVVQPAPGFRQDPHRDLLFGMHPLLLVRIYIFAFVRGRGSWAVSYYRARK